MTASALRGNVDTVLHEDTKATKITKSLFYAFVPFVFFVPS